MRNNYDFSNSIKNPYYKQLKTQVTIDLDRDIITYLDKISQETGISSANLINLYLRDCMENKRKFTVLRND